MKNGNNLIHSFNDTGAQGNFNGLTKREHFAGLALQGVLAHNHPQNPTPNQAEEIVKYAIGLADELLKQLEE